MLTPIQQAIEIIRNRIVNDNKLTTSIISNPSYVNGYNDAVINTFHSCIGELEKLLNIEKNIIESAYDSGVGHVIYKNDLPIGSTKVTQHSVDYFKVAFNQ